MRHLYGELLWGAETGDPQHGLLASSARSAVARRGTSTHGHTGATIAERASDENVTLHLIEQGPCNLLVVPE